MNKTKQEENKPILKNNKMGRTRCKQPARKNKNINILNVKSQIYNIWMLKKGSRVKDFLKHQTNSCP